MQYNYCESTKIVRKSLAGFVTGGDLCGLWVAQWHNLLEVSVFKVLAFSCTLETDNSSQALIELWPASLVDVSYTHIIEKKSGNTSQLTRCSRPPWRTTVRNCWMLSPPLDLWWNLDIYQQGKGGKISTVQRWAMNTIIFYEISYFSPPHHILTVTIYIPFKT